MYLPLLKTIGGIVLLTVGAELLVSASVSLSRRVGLSPLIIGLTVVSLGTSMPELVVSFGAVLRGTEALGVGNVVGSNISNIALILGLAALVRPLRVEAQVIRLDAPILVGVSVVFVGLILDGKLSRWEGGMLTAGVLGYFIYSVWATQGSASVVQQEFSEGLPSQHGMARDLGFVALGIGGLVAGADLLVQGAVHVAHMLSLPNMVVGLTVVAVGTSLPELATSVLAAYRGNGDIAIGNALGSCILNLLGILGLTAAIFPLSTVGLTSLELGLMIGVAVLLVPLLRSDFLLSRQEGSLLLIVYAGYLWLLFGG